MVDNKTIGVSSLITLGIVTMVMLVPGFFDDPTYYCESRPNLGVVQCDDFSKYVALNGKCIRDDNTNLICRDGWVLVTNDTTLPEETETPKGEVGQQYLCSPEGCVKI